MSTQNQETPTIEEMAGMLVVDLLRERRERQIYGKVLDKDERREVQEHGRILNGQERRQLQRERNATETARQAGVACASTGGKQKQNPHPGGSAEWWGWHEGYKSTRAKQEAEKRRAAK